MLCLVEVYEFEEHLLSDLRSYSVLVRVFLIGHLFSLSYIHDYYVSCNSCAVFCARQEQTTPFGKIISRESGMHALRHAAGTILYRVTDGNFELVRRFLRHDQDSTTRRYIHDSGEMGVALKAVEAMSQVYFAGAVH